MLVAWKQPDYRRNTPFLGTVVEAVRVKQDGDPLALLMSAADGSAFTVTATFAGSATVRVYTFATAAETNAFLTDTADSEPPKLPIADIADFCSPNSRPAAKASTSSHRRVLRVARMFRRPPTSLCLRGSRARADGGGLASV